MRSLRDELVEQLEAARDALTQPLGSSELPGRVVRIGFEVRTLDQIGYLLALLDMVK